MSAAPHIDAAAESIRPPPDLDVPDWADQRRRLSQSEASEPGRWRTDRTPYLREIMECLSAHHQAREIVFMKGAQIGGTEAILNALGYVMDHSPGPTMVVMPTDGTASDWSRDRLGAMIRSTPCLDTIFGPSSRNPNNATKRKKFPGGFIKIAHATSASELRSRPIRFLFLDEVDGYPVDVDGEGDPVELAERRTSTYGATKKVVKVSTPLIKSSSRIEPAYEASDRRKYFVPCLDCDHYQVIEWDRIQWPKGKPEEAAFACEECGCISEEHRKTEMLRRGEWRATNPGAEEGHVGFHLSALYSPVGWFSWADAATKWVKANESKSTELLRTFINTVLGRTWEQQGARPDWEKLYLRREEYTQGTVPDGALVLTAGVDVQKDRLEVEVVGWGPSLESWSVDYAVIGGDTSADGVWKKLDALLERDWPHESGGALKIKRMCVDSGYRSQRVYRYCSQHHPTRVLAVKGRDSQDVATKPAKPVEHSKGGTKIRSGAWLMMVGSDVVKREIYGWLGLPIPDEDAEGYPSGWCHFPEYGQEYFKQMTAEKEVATVVRGRTKYAFRKVRERNEALDCRVYARTAAISEGVDRWRDEKWSAIRDRLKSPQVAPSEGDAPPRYQSAERNSRGRRKGSFRYE